MKKTILADISQKMTAEFKGQKYYNYYTLADMCITWLNDNFCKPEDKWLHPLYATNRGNDIKVYMLNSIVLTITPTIMASTIKQNQLENKIEEMVVSTTKADIQDEQSLRDIVQEICQRKNQEMDERINDVEEELQRKFGVSLKDAKEISGIYGHLYWNHHKRAEIIEKL